ncbi:hypothetical protein KC328_g100 [Hortaea werneckii]|nr:hypothetical protein KC328_g100 [Hortaea werneckii]
MTELQKLCIIYPLLGLPEHKRSEGLWEDVEIMTVIRESQGSSKCVFSSSGSVDVSVFNTAARGTAKSSSSSAMSCLARTPLPRCCCRRSSNWIFEETVAPVPSSQERNELDF